MIGEITHWIWLVIKAYFLGAVAATLIFAVVLAFTTLATQLTARCKWRMPKDNARQLPPWKITSEALDGRLEGASRKPMGFIGHFYSDNWTTHKGRMASCFMRYMLDCGINIYLVADRPDGLTDDERDLANKLNAKHN